MGPEARELKKFLDAIHENPRDLTTRLVYADWLDEHDEPELADEQRKFNLEKHDAEQWLREFHKKYDPWGSYEEMVEGALKGSYGFNGSDEGPQVLQSQWGDKDEFWKNIEIVAEKVIDHDHRENASFRCGC